jgi:outer membrane usher protein
VLVCTRVFTRTTGVLVKQRRAVPRWCWVGALIACASWAQGTEGFHGVVVNGLKQAEFAMLVFDAQARPYMVAADFKRLGFARSPPSQQLQGLVVVPLEGHQGLSVRIDGNAMRVLIEVEPHWYSPTRLNLRAPRAGLPLAAPAGALLNYSVQASRAQPGALVLTSSQSVSFFGPAGQLQWHSAARSASSDPRSTPRFLRLGTTFVRDNLQQRTTTTLGDSVLPASVGVPAVRYGGLTWGSHFGLDPGFSTLNTPSLFDTARLPSTLEFYLNDRRVGSPVAVPPGPFEITGLPTVGVQGTLQVLVRDALQNERTVSLPFVQHAGLYRPGLHSFSYTVGWLRPELERYDTSFVASAHRWGVTPRLTLDAGAALSARQRSAGLGSTVALSPSVIASLSLAASQAPSGSGQQVGASAQWRGQQASMGGSYRQASAGFHMLGDTSTPDQRAQQDLRFYAAHTLDHGLGSLSLSWGQLTPGSGSPRRISSVGWSGSRGGIHLSLSAVHTNNSAAIQAVLNMPLQRGAYLSTRLQYQSDQLAWRTDVNTQAATDRGLSWRLGLQTPDLARNITPSQWVAAVDARTSVGEHGLEWGQGPQGSAWRVRTAGSVGYLAGHTFVAPPISGGFALVSTGDAPHVPIYRWNVPVAVSNAQGLAVVTTLVPYQKNLLAVQPQDVPLHYRMDRYEVTAIPHGRGGVWVDLAMAREHPALITLTLPNGQYLPAGAVVRVASSGEMAPVGLRGLVYVHKLAEQDRLDVQHLWQTCAITVQHPLTTDPQPRLGPLVCRWDELTP